MYIYTPNLSINSQNCGSEKPEQSRVGGAINHIHYINYGIQFLFDEVEELTSLSNGKHQTLRILQKRTTPR